MVRQVAAVTSHVQCVHGTDWELFPQPRHLQRVVDSKIPWSEQPRFLYVGFIYRQTPYVRTVEGHHFGWNQEHYRHRRYSAGSHGEYWTAGSGVPGWKRPTLSTSALILINVTQAKVTLVQIILLSTRYFSYYSWVCRAGSIRITLYLLYWT